MISSLGGILVAFFRAGRGREEKRGEGISGREKEGVGRGGEEGEGGEEKEDFIISRLF